MTPIKVFALMDAQAFIKDAKNKHEATQIKDGFMKGLIKIVTMRNAKNSNFISESTLSDVKSIYSKAFDLAIFCKFHNHKHLIG